MTTTTTTVDGIDIEAGDVLAFLGATYRIDRLEPASPATRAYAGTWSITVVADVDCPARWSSSPNVPAGSAGSGDGVHSFRGIH